MTIACFAAIQMTSRVDVGANLQVAAKHIDTAVNNGAHRVV